MSHCQKQPYCELHSAYNCKSATVMRLGRPPTLDEADDPMARITRVRADRRGRTGGDQCQLTGVINLDDRFRAASLMKRLSRLDPELPEGQSKCRR
jgi:hypothetical protein